MLGVEAATVLLAHPLRWGFGFCSGGRLTRERYSRENICAASAHLRYSSAATRRHESESRKRGGEATLAGECRSASCPARADLNVAAGNETGKEGATI